MSTFSTIGKGLNLVNCALKDPLFDVLWDNDLEDRELKMAIPGYGKEDVKITLKGRDLTVQVKDVLTETFKVPRGTKKEHLSISVKNGMLTIKLNPPEEEEISIEIT